MTITNESVKESLEKIQFFAESAKQSLLKVEEERQSYLDQSNAMDKINFLNKQMVELNVGGEVFCTTLETLTQTIDYDQSKDDESDNEDSDDEEKDTRENDIMNQPHMFQVMFGSNFSVDRDRDGKYFIDRDPTHFRYILNYLRAKGEPEKFILPLEDEDLMNEILIEAKFYNITPLIKYIQGDSSTNSIFKGSTLLNNKLAKTVNGFYGKKNQKWKLLYKATKDGFASTSFHSKCDNKGPTITIVKTNNGNIFGGYNEISWNQSNQYLYNGKCFIFKLKDASNSSEKPAKFTNTGAHAGGKYSIYCGSSYGPTFGGGHDFYVCNNSNTVGSSYSNLGHSYAVPGQTYGSTTIKTVLAGSYNFTTTDVEVFALSK